MLEFTALSTPRGDGETLVEPDAERLVALVEANVRHLAGVRVEIHGRDFHELRAATRSTLADQRGDAPVIVTGHQPEFYHAGVWAKNFLASRLAGALGGRALNLVVDNDAPKKTTLTVPHRQDDLLVAREVPFAQYKVGWAFEQFPALSEQAGRRFLAEIREVLGDEAYEGSSMPLIASALTDRSHARDLVDQVTAARKTVEARFGLDLIERRVSQVWTGPMLLDMVLKADRYAECYNAALADYRAEQGIGGTQRPVPDLVWRADRVELPVWVYRYAEARRRLFVERQADTIAFYANETDIGSLGVADLKRDDALDHLSAVIGWWFRPRALTLTTWARLLLADLFIHGIGGAKYDRITDRLIKRYFGIDPPAMACASATVRMPTKRFPVRRDDLLAARRRCRDVHYNPQRYLSAITAGLSELLQRRIDAIAESDRLRREDRHHRHARREVFQTIRRLNADLLSADESLPDRLTTNARLLERQLAHNAVADSREYFFGLLPISKLEQLASSLPSVESFRAGS